MEKEKKGLWERVNGRSSRAWHRFFDQAWHQVPTQAGTLTSCSPSHRLPHPPLISDLSLLPHGRTRTLTCTSFPRTVQIGCVCLSHGSCCLLLSSRVLTVVLPLLRPAAGDSLFDTLAFLRSAEGRRDYGRVSLLFDAKVSMSSVGESFHRTLVRSGPLLPHPDSLSIHLRLARILQQASSS